MSCPIQILTPNGVDIDEARLTCCDTTLETTIDEVKNTVDYSAFFDVGRLNALIDDHYAGS